MLYLVLKQFLQPLVVYSINVQIILLLALTDLIQYEETVKKGGSAA